MQATELATYEVQKDPNAKLEYGFEWMASDGVTNDGTAADDGYLQGDIITASTWTVTGADALLVVASSSFTDTTTTVRLTGGTVGVTYGVINHITMASTLEDDRTLYVEVVQK